MRSCPHQADTTAGWVTSTHRLWCQVPRRKWTDMAGERQEQVPCRASDKAPLWSQCWKGAQWGASRNILKVGHLPPIWILLVEQKRLPDELAPPERKRRITAFWVEIIRPWARKQFTSCDILDPRISTKQRTLWTGTVPQKIINGQQGFPDP